MPQRRLLLCHGLVPAVRSDDVTGARASSARQGTGTARPVAVQQLPNLAAGPDGTPVTAEFVIGAYHQLFQIEKSFRMVNSDLQARPIYHRIRDSIEAHLTIVFAALAVSRWTEHQTGGQSASSSRPPAATAPSRSKPARTPSPPAPSPTTCARPSTPSTPASLHTKN